MAGELVDITAWLKGAAADLPVGHMVKKPELALLDAMSSIELFNPKMDTGMALSARTETADENGAGPSRQFASNREPLFDPHRDWRPEQILWIMDEMLSNEIAWYKGVNLAQSVFECLYYMHIDKLHGPNTPELVTVVLQAWLAAYCKCIDLAYKELSKGHVGDMEDVWMDHFGIAVHLDDLSVDIDRQLEIALEWLETWEYMESNGEIAGSGDDGADKTQKYRAAFQDRLRARQTWLRALHFIPEAPPYTHRPGPGDPVPTEPPNGLVFDSVTPHLRQMMPPPVVTKPSHAKASLVMEQILDSVDNLVKGHDLLSWQLATRGRAWLSTEPSIVRSLHKTWLDARVDKIAGRYMSGMTGGDDLLSKVQAPDNLRQQVAIWRDIIGGLTITTLSTPFLNRARQRRSYQNLSFRWRERAAMAHWLHLDGRLVDVLHSIRIDCLLEGALAAFDCDLISTHEERQSWWWIWQVANRRPKNHSGDPSENRDWAETWTKIWLEIAQMMFLLLSLNPIPGPDTQQAFELRHKWAIKIPAMSDGTKLEIGLTPIYHVWCEERDKSRDPDETRASILKHGDAALEAMLRLHRSDLGSDSKDIRLVLGDLREDVCHNMQSKSATWGKRRRWIPLLHETKTG